MTVYVTPPTATLAVTVAMLLPGFRIRMNVPGVVEAPGAIVIAPLAPVAAVSTSPELRRRGSNGSATAAGTASGARLTQ